MLLNRGNRVLFGNEINEYIKPQEVKVNNTSTMNNEEHAFSFMDSATGGFGVTSDNYSFLDQNPDELSAQRKWGYEQQHHYADLNYQVK